MIGWMRKILKSGFKASYSNAFPWLYVAKITPKGNITTESPWKQKCLSERQAFFYDRFCVISVLYCPL